LNQPVSSWELDDWYRDKLIEFGELLRSARQRVGLTQMALEERSGVDQTLISRLERGKAAGCSLHRLLALSDALGRDLPFGVCPHDHRCQFGPPDRAPLLDHRGGWDFLRCRE
jgi:transcriptional regulator with XRE-family HTH domain